MEWAETWSSLVGECRVKLWGRERKKLCFQADPFLCGVFELGAGIQGLKTS